MPTLLRIVVAIGAASLCAACASVPTGPSVMVLPGSRKNFDEFAADDAVCRDWAARQSGTTTSRASTESGVTSAAIGTGVGAAAGAAIGAATGAAGAGAAIGAGSGLLLGSAVGVDQANASGGAVQQRYDGAYVQCMYAKGNQIPVAGGVTPSESYAPEPPPPPRAKRGTARGTARHIPPPPPGPPPPPPPDAS
ncbi:MAG TPA: glycine zipper family protein [Myxococcota bacterium]|jgi:hypothetical protein|nr:glycine zipper family protein [Myxococcota bacterium]